MDKPQDPERFEAFKAKQTYVCFIALVVRQLLVTMNIAQKARLVKSHFSRNACRFRPVIFSFVHLYRSSIAQHLVQFKHFSTLFRNPF